MKGFKEITPIRKWRLLYGAIIFAINIISVFILYTHYGPLTENGNRYYHYFDLSSMDWYVLGHCLCAFVFLLIPWIFFNNYSSKSFIGLFPTKSRFGKWCSSLLIGLNFGTGVLFTVSFLLITIEYITNSSRVMAEDLETIELILAFISCSIFWGIVDLVYFATHRKTIIENR